MLPFDEDDLFTAADRDGTPVLPGFYLVDVPGAPYLIGELVRVVDLDQVEALQLEDATLNADYASRMGRVVGLRYECVAGEHYPDEPMVRVKLSDEEVDLFWPEELIPLVGLLGPIAR